MVRSMVTSAPLRVLLVLAALMGRPAGSTAGVATICPPDPAERSRRSPHRFRPRRDFDAPVESADGFASAHAFERAYPESPASPRLHAILALPPAVAAIVRRRGTATASAWRFLGPAGVEASEATASFLPRNYSGRATAFAIAPKCSVSSCRAWLGTAGGGVWKTERALDSEDQVSWSHLDGGIVGNTIGALALDPNDATGNSLYAGTGEANFNFTSGAGTGLYRSVDGGATWNRLDTRLVVPGISDSPIDFTASRGISRVLVEPGDAATVYVATAYAFAGMSAVRGGQAVLTGGVQAPVGLYRTRDGGSTWALLWAAPIAEEEPTEGMPPGARVRSQGVRDVLLDPGDPATIYASAFNAGVFRSSARLEGGDTSFKPIFWLIGGNGNTTAAAIAMASGGGRTRLWAGNGVDDDDLQGVYRADDVDLPAAMLASAPGDLPVNLSPWSLVTSGDPDAPGYATFGFCSTQCGYDQVLAVPPGDPDGLYVGGSSGGLIGDPVVRTGDAGTTFSSFGYDAAEPVGLMHGDVHAIAFDPDDPSIVFVVSDGGVVRSAGGLVDGSALCTSPTIGFLPDDPGLPACLRTRSAVPDRFVFLNRGLATFQFYSVSADPRDPLGHVMGGTQDNGTLALDSRVSDRWSPFLPVGDGVGGGFHPARSDIAFGAANGLNFYTHRDAGTGTGTWVWTSGPILASKETISLSPFFSGRQFFTIDPVHPDTQFTGAEHVWRTTDNGGDPGFLDLHCVLFAIDHDLRDQCGDWAPLGPKLTDPSFGDRAGGVVAAAARTRADSGTLWAATSTGRLFLSENADAADAGAVVFRRIDDGSPSAPNRFVTSIAADPADPGRAWVAYSGFSALTPGTPGHVFEVTRDTGEVFRWTAIDDDLGDVPVNHLVLDDATGDLYAATDFGVLRRSSSGHWTGAGRGLPDVMTPFLEILPDQRLLFAATHGLGVWYLDLPPKP